MNNGKSIDFTPEVDETNTSPDSVTDRVLQKLRIVYPESRTKDDLVCDPLIDGKPAAIQKCLSTFDVWWRGVLRTICHFASMQH